MFDTKKCAGCEYHHIIRTYGILQSYGCFYEDRINGKQLINMDACPLEEENEAESADRAVQEGEQND